jgi:hypothetical protein
MRSELIALPPLRKEVNGDVNDCPHETENKNEAENDHQFRRRETLVILVHMDLQSVGN